MSTATLVKEISVDGMTVRSSNSVNPGARTIISEAIPANQTDLEVACAFTNSKLKRFIAYSDVAMTILTNENVGGTPQDKLFLLAGQMYDWSLTGSFMGEVGDSAASPFDGNVTSIFVTNTTAGTLTIIYEVDPT